MVKSKFHILDFACVRSPGLPTCSSELAVNFGRERDGDNFASTNITKTSS